MFFSENFKFLRNKTQLSQADFGKLIGLGRDSIASLEAGRMKPSLDTLIKLREKFNISLDELVFKDLSKEEI